jgi:hypothetical protein
MMAPGGPRPVRAWLCLGLLLGVPWQMPGRGAAGRAAEPPEHAVEPADENLIEFLGSVDSDDEGWKQFLARQGAQMPAARKPPPAPPPSSAPAKTGADDEH